MENGKIIFGGGIINVQKNYANIFSFYDKRITELVCVG
jgi:hypothetical protein